MTQGLGVEVRFLDGASFTFIDVGIHFHSKEEETECTFRAGVYFTFFNFNVAFGLFRA